MHKAWHKLLYNRKFYNKNFFFKIRQICGGFGLQGGRSVAAGTSLHSVGFGSWVRAATWPPGPPMSSWWHHSLHLCTHPDCASYWLRCLAHPFVRPRAVAPKAFSLCGLSQHAEVVSHQVDCQWLSPAGATKSFLSKDTLVGTSAVLWSKIWKLPLFPICIFCLDYVLEGRKRQLPLIISCWGTGQLSPDELYLDNSDFSENHSPIGKKRLKKSWRQEILEKWFNCYSSSIHMNVQSINKFILKSVE